LVHCKQIKIRRNQKRDYKREGNRFHLISGLGIWWQAIIETEGEAVPIV